MMMSPLLANGLIIIIVCLTIGGAIAYIVKEKKRGVKCIGCPMSGQCKHSMEQGGKGCSCQNTNIKPDENNP